MEYKPKNNIAYDDLDLLDIGRALKDKLLVILLCGVIFAAVTAAYCFLVVKPIYQSTVKLYIMTNSNSVVSFSDIQIGSKLARDYQELIKSRQVINETNSILGLDYSYGQMANSITFDNPDDTRILKISVTNNDPELAAKIANTVASVGSEKISRIMKTDAPQVIDKAIPSQYPINSSKTKTIGLGFLAGIGIASLIVIFKHITNDKIKTEEDVERAVGLIVLANIPDEKIGGTK